MRLLTSLSLLLLPLLSLTAASSSKAPPAESKLEKFTALSTSSKSTKNSVLQLTDKLYEELTTGPRDYTAVVLLTALDSRFACQLCKTFQPEYELLSKSWTGKHHGGDGLFFTMLDFVNGKATFQKLQLTTAPALYIFPPTTGPNAQPQHATIPLQFDFLQNDVPAESLAAFISSHTAHTPTVTRPVDYTKFLKIMSSVIAAATVGKLAAPIVLPLLNNRNLWAALSLIAILLFTSGHMFNHIRKVPYVANNGRGGVSYIAGGFSNQFGLETQIVAVVYAVLAFSTISLAMKIPRIKDVRKQKFAVWAWNAVLLVGFSFLMSLFKQKNGSYPFFLPPIMS